MSGVNLEQKFLDRISIPGDYIDGCWIWIGAMHKGGYGHLKFDGITRLAHRISWELFNGPIPEGFLVLHKCDNPPCVNPNHLFLGDHADNMKDMWDKGRHSIDHIKNLNEKGNSHSAKLSFEEVTEVRELYSTGLVTMAMLAIYFNITSGTVCKIVNLQQRIDM